MKKRIVILGIVLVFMIGTFAGLVKGADNYDNLTVNTTIQPSQYPGGVPSSWYAPGDPIIVKVTMDTGSVDDGFADKFDLVLFPDTSWTWADRISWEDGDDVEVPESGEIVVEIPGETTELLSDDNFYILTACDTYIEESGTPPLCGGASEPPVTYEWDVFYIKQYRIIANLNKNGYVPGDKVKVFYTVQNIKDGSLVDETKLTNIEREWNANSDDGELETDGTFTGTSGTIEFTIPSDGGVEPVDYDVYLYYNATGEGGATREYWVSLDPYVDTIDIEEIPGEFDFILNDPPFRINDVMRIGVKVVVDGPSTPVEGATVKIEILEGTGAGATKVSGYEVETTSDNKGEAYYIFQTDESDFDEEKTYTVKAFAKKNLKEDEDTTNTFYISKIVASISVNAVTDKGVYYSGEEVSLSVDTSVMEDHSDPNNYVYTIYSGSIYYIKEPSSSDEYTYTLPTDFEGSMCFKVEAFNADGDYGTDTICVDVVYANLAVNANPQWYSPNNVITVTYTLDSESMTDPTYYYRIDDAGGSVFEEGTTTGGSFTFTIPEAPSDSYKISVFAYEDGRQATNSRTVRLNDGFFLSIKLDRDIYTRGDSMKISYELVNRGDAKAPATLQIRCALGGGWSQYYSSTKPTGEFTYNIPSNMNEGTLVLTCTETTTGAQAIEAIPVRGHNPLWWANLAEIPAFSIILLILIIILFILYFRMRRGAAPMRGAPEETAAAAPPPVAPGETPPPPPGTGPGAETAVQGGTALSVPCKSCGAPIELTTSKRPIEVMCPSCGETQMAY